MLADEYVGSKEAGRKEYGNKHTPFFMEAIFLFVHNGYISIRSFLDASYQLILKQII